MLKVPGDQQLTLYNGAREWLNASLTLIPATSQYSSLTDISKSMYDIKQNTKEIDFQSYSHDMD